MKTAIILGATGLTGTELVKQLLNDDYYKKVVLFSRKSTNINHCKLTEYITDFDQLHKIKHLIIGDIVFCCLGTTIKAAGSKTAFREVDFKYISDFAEFAKQNGLNQFYLQSSVGADSKSKNFYLKTKGETENAIRKLDFESFTIFRPSMLLGNRIEFRFGETLGKLVMQFFSFLFVGRLKLYKAIDAKQVAKAMIYESKLNKVGNFVFENDKLLDY
ncbi:MAG: NAD(P)H-binding protein [Bacteroidia bacterium]|nr:NAD(P)H-binding protein [Bacteroidia bacterium]